LLGAIGAACGPIRSAPPVALEADSVEVGYGNQSRRDVTGAIGTVAGSDLETMRVTSVEEMLRRVPGVEVSRGAGGMFSVRIRGSTTFMGSAEPLFVIDGVPLSGARSGYALLGINPQDVARIDVLKDAGSTAIYGSQGANGVIIITTKRQKDVR
jgi:TonB-dependent SusC/RagA subfamily outer membrane receptor